ncbi:TPA: esterase [Corynebacterium striatum]|uniref:alpha/beta hydrolase family esterase n=1 Tax=Corynebacterium striatum TaxID=43770 RepID=UPI00080A8AF8|nr:hypothetical protein [Corynebacterium striatum]HAT1137417.1 esterase [Corynebacterium striatum]HAT1144777.1 esterase [Corynebacterium striatum]HAT1168341.1 esterase [Corynebacterium striatum]HAT1173357.1 esterase [Corynebacterium striatum]HAT1195181.1 esterase [Corynebacterium striatum]
MRHPLKAALCILAGAATIGFATGCSTTDEPGSGPHSVPTHMVTASESAPLPASGSTETGHYRTIELPTGRSFMAHVPDNYDPTKPAPVVMVFHGYKSDPSTIFQDTELYEANAITLFPAGKAQAWAPAPYAQTSLDEDLAFVDAALAWANQNYNTDGRVFAAGFSNGGGFVRALACNRSLDGAATVSAANYEGVDEDCQGDPTAYLAVHGTADVVINYRGGEAHGGHYKGAEDSIAKVAEHNHCDPFPAEDKQDDVTRFTWGSCAMPTVNYKIKGGTHTWNGGVTDRSGLVPHDWATNSILDFFKVEYPGRVPSR